VRSDEWNVNFEQAIRQHSVANLETSEMWQWHLSEIGQPGWSQIA
jgi:hypothetical protein